MKTIKEDEFVQSCHKGDLEIVKKYLNEGVDINYQDEKDFTGLMMASLYGNLELVEYLVEHGANINLTDEFGDTALDIADRNNNTHIVNYFNMLKYKRRKKIINKLLKNG